MKYVVALTIAASLMAQTTPAPKAPAAKAHTAKAPAAKAAAKTTAKAAAKGPNLLNPASLRAKPPGIFVVRLETTKGNIDIRVVRNWAPNGVERFYNLVTAGFYDNNYFFRSLDFMAQFGIPSRPDVAKVWDDRTMFDDRVLQSNKRGTVTFASTGQPNSRGTQVFINKLDRNSYLDELKFAPFGEVVAGMEVVDMLYTGYGEDAGQRQYEITNEGEAFITKYFPRLDKIIKASVIAVPQP
jgi:peptidyl-prolyl cis-trans isomerase A (cyclophilin A)